MSRLRVNCFSISLDGYGAGPNQDQQNPLGKDGTDLHQWFYPTRTFKGLFADPNGGTTGVDDDFARQGMENVGAWILGRNMFGPIRGEWPDAAWRGWWGDNPPYHVPVFVLTHHARQPLVFATCVSAEASRPSANTCAPGWSTKCSARSVPCCSALASTCYKTSTSA